LRDGKGGRSDKINLFIRKLLENIRGRGGGTCWALALKEEEWNLIKENKLVRNGGRVCQSSSLFERAKLPLRKGGAIALTAVGYVGWHPDSRRGDWRAMLRAEQQKLDKEGLTSLENSPFHLEQEKRA